MSNNQTLIQIKALQNDKICEKRIKISMATNWRLIFTRIYHYKSIRNTEMKRLFNNKLSYNIFYVYEDSSYQRELVVGLDSFS